MKRSELPDSVFGIPEERKYPMPDKRHTLSAIKLFGHVEPKYEEELAKNIIKNMKKYNIPESAVGKDNKLRKYIDKYYNEASLLEGYIFNEKDIYYNKDKFDSGEINLCFITGHSGSGKSTMGRNMEKDKVEHYELDDLQCIKDHFTMEQLKEYGDLIYSYFSGPGKKFYLTYKELVDNKISGSEYEDILFKDFVYYAMRYAKAHKDKKIVVEGVWLFCNSENGKPWFSPEEFKDYAFYIKGTSMVISKHRAAKRDAKEDTDNKKDEIKSYLNNFIRKNWKWYFTDEKAINRFRKYFSNLIKKDQMNESYFTSDPNRKISVDVLEEAGKKCIQLSSECAYITPVQPNKIWVNEEDNTFTFAIYNGDMKYLSEIVDYFNKNNLFKYGRFRVYAKDVYDEDISLSNHMNTKWWLRGEVIECNNTIKEEARLEENKIPCLYHLSTENHDGDVFEPRYYDNDNVKAGIERRVKRICFSDNINGCIYSIFPNGAYDIDLYVHIPASEVSKVYETTSDDIYDSEITHELWVKEPVTMKCIGKIHISGVDKNKEKILNSDKDKTGYGKRKYYEPRWNWVEKSKSSVQENYVFNENDIYYNKDKFDAGLTNLCFITGHGGSGKSTMGAYMAQDKNIEHVEIDDVIWCWRFINRPFEHGSMLESFFTVGPGKKYLGTSKQEMRIKFSNYDEDIIREFMDFAYKFARTHKNKKYAIEGVQLFLYINPEELTDYAVYIKGTSACVSIFRAVKRDYHKYKNATTSEKIKKSIDRIIVKLENVKETESAIEKYRKYFSKLMQTNESAITEYSMKPLKPEQMKEYYKWFKVVFNDTKDSITEKETKSTKVIYYNNEIIGYVAFSRYKDGNERYLGLGNFMIIPKYQRSGHGANVVKYIIDKYKDDYNLIYCWVDRSNTNAVNFYKKIAKVNMNTQSNPDQYYVEFYRKGKKNMNKASNLNEFSVGAGPVVGIGSNPEPIYIVNYMQNNVFSGATQERFGICKTGMADLHIFGGKYNRLHCTDLDNFEKEASNIKMYRYTGQLSDKYPSIYSIIEDSDTDLDFYRLLTGEDISNRSDIKNNPNFVKESYVRDELSAISECVVSGVKEVDNKYEIPLLGLNEDGRTYNYYRDLDGVYIKNEVTNIRSASYSSAEDILEDVSNLVKKGVLY